MRPTKEFSDFIRGDVSKLRALALLSHDDLREIYEDIGPIIVTTTNIQKVLEKFKNGEVEQNEVQQWASFIRRGYLHSGVIGPISPLDLPYQSKNEDLIVRVIARLDELGDKIDGEMSKTEIDDLLSQLSD